MQVVLLKYVPGFCDFRSVFEVFRDPFPVPLCTSLKFLEAAGCLPETNLRFLEAAGCLPETNLRFLEALFLSLSARILGF